MKAYGRVCTEQINKQLSYEIVYQWIKDEARNVQVI